MPPLTTPAVDPFVETHAEQSSAVPSSAKNAPPAFLALLGIGLVLAIAFLIKPEKHLLLSPVGQGFSIRSIEALADDASVAILEDETSHHWLARIEANGHAAWVKPLHGAPQRVAVGELAWSTNHDAVFVRLVRTSGDVVDVHAFSLSDGVALWTTKLVSASELRDNGTLEGVVVSEFSLEATDDVVAAIGRDHTDVVFLDARTGGVVSRLDGVSNLRPPQFLGEEIVVLGGLGLVEGGVTIVGPKSSRRYEGDIVCGTGPDAITLENTGGQPRIRPIGWQGAGTTLHGLFGYFERCAQYRDRFVGLTAAYGREVRVVMFDRAGVILQDIRLGARFVRGELAQGRPGAPFFGEVSRFVPLIVGADEESQLVMIDLEEGRIAWRSTPQFHLQSSVLFGNAGDWYWLNSTYGPGVIARFDGATGGLAVAVAHAGGLQAVDRGDVAGSIIWVSGYDARDVNRLQLAALDAKSLLPRGDTDLAFKDVTVRVRQWFGR